MKKEKSGIAFIVSFLMIALSVTFFVSLRANNYYVSKEVNILNSEVKAADKRIKKEVSNNKFLEAEIKAKRSNLLLAKHTYFTKALNLVRNNLVAGVYLNKLSISVEKEKEEKKKKEREFVAFKFSGVAKDYQSILSQIYIFKNLSNIESVNITEISLNGEGYQNFGGLLKFKKEILFYKK